MIMTKVIAIDGPSGSGKSTVAKIISNRLNLQYIDTGAMYRAITYKILRDNVDLSDEASLTQLLAHTKFNFMDSNLYMDDKIVGNEIREPQIDKHVSTVAASKHVRESLTAKQVQLGLDKPSVMDGRDIGSVLFPDAILKIYLTADVNSRAKRRYLQNIEKGIYDTSIEEIREDIAQRDYLDSTRKISPLIKATDAVEIDTSHIDIEETVDKIIKLFYSRMDGLHV